MELDSAFAPESLLKRPAKGAHPQALLSVGQIPSDDSWLYVTNGTTAAVRVPVFTFTDDVTGTIPLEAFTAARKARTRGTKVLRIDTEPATVRTRDGASFARPYHPLPAHAHEQVIAEAPESEHVIRLDPRALLAIAEAIGADEGIAIHVPRDGARSLRVTDAMPSFEEAHRAVGVLALIRNPV